MDGESPIGKLMNVRKKDERLEYLRIISCAFVVLGHITNWYMRAYPDMPMDSYVYSVFFNGVCRVSVPIFFMISGALLLEQPIDYKKNTKRTANFLLKTVVWTLVYMVWDYVYLGAKYDMHMIFDTPIRNHFWFMYVMVGIYLTLPLWQKLVSGDSKELLRYFTVIFILVLGATFVITSFKMGIAYEIPLVGSSVYAGYFIMGYAIRHYIDEIRIKKWICIVVLILCAAATDFLTFFFSVKIGTHIEVFSSFKSFFVGIAALTLFYLFMKMENLRHYGWMSIISKHSFNIYMMHVFFLDILQENIDVAQVSAWIGYPVFFVFLISLSLGFSWFFEWMKGKNKSIL